MSDPAKRRRFQTRAVHTHRPPPPDQLSSSMPIFQSSTFRFETNDEFARAIRFDGPGYVYSRGYGNPTIDAFQLAMADLEEAESAMGFASGMAAISSLFLTVAGAGSRIVAGTALYGGTVSMLRTHPAPIRRRGNLRRSDGSRSGARCAARRRPLLLRDDRQPDDHGARSRGLGRPVPRGRCRVRGRQHVRVALPLQSGGARVRRGDPLRDQVHRGARGPDRRCCLYQRGSLPEAARHGDRPRRHDAAAGSMAVPAGPRHAQPADAAPLRVRGTARGGPRRASVRGARVTIRVSRPIRSMRSRLDSSATSEAPSRSRWPAGSRRAAASRRRWSSGGSRGASEAS